MTVHTWKARRPEFKAAMDQAYEIRAERLADGGMKLAMTLAEGSNIFFLTPIESSWGVGDHGVTCLVVPKK